MKRITITENNIKDINECAACIGTFDGFHRGHFELIKKTLAIANKKKIKSALITFYPEPQELISDNFTRIMTINEKQELCNILGFDYFIVVKFTKNTLNLSANNFITDYLNKLNINTLICGFDYTFGKNSKGNPNLLIKKGKFNTIVVEEKQYYGKKISTSRIKSEYYKGNFALINKLLGRELIIKLNIIEMTKEKKKYILKCLPIDNKFMKIKDGNYNDFKVIDNYYYFIAPYKISKKSLLVYVYSN